jgi:hypothetical protein
VFGDTINLSARLMMKARNEVQRDNIWLDNPGEIMYFSSKIHHKISMPFDM